jgi:hypothetical protein
MEEWELCSRKYFKEMTTFDAISKAAHHGIYNIFAKDGHR